MTIEEILKKAQIHSSRCGDDALRVDTGELMTLIHAGAEVVGDEYHSSDKYWMTKVRYGGFIFVAVSGSKLGF